MVSCNSRIDFCGLRFMPTFPPVNPSDAEPGFAATSSTSPWITTLPPLLMVVGIVLLIILIMMNMRGRRLRRAEASLTARERIDKLKAEAGTRGGDAAAAAETLDQVQRMSGQLNARAAYLQRLIELADARIAQLRRLDDAPATEAPPRSSREMEPRTVNRADAPTDPLTRQVYDLADANVSSVDIARRLQEEIGKVELILALRDQSSAD
jgi:hypothetical protein